MEMTDTNGMGTPAPMQGSRPEIMIPAPATQQVQGNTDEQLELERRYKIQPLEPSRYLREKQTGVVHKWSPDFGKRSDLMEPYTPTLRELIQFGEYVNDLIGWGYTAEQVWQNGATAEQLQDAQVPLEELIRIGIPPEKLHALGYAIQIEAAPVKVIKAPPVQKMSVPASAPVVRTSTAATPPPPPPG